MNNGNEPATKADLQALEQRIEGKMDAQEQRILDSLGEMIRESETNLLKAFYSYADTNNKRVDNLETSDAGIVARVSTLENRILEIEKRLNMPPQ